MVLSDPGSLDQLQRMPVGMPALSRAEKAVCVRVISASHKAMVRGAGNSLLFVLAVSSPPVEFLMTLFVSKSRVCECRE
jgi:hypothetical protein